MLSQERRDLHSENFDCETRVDSLKILFINILDFLNQKIIDKIPYPYIYIFFFNPYLTPKFFNLQYILFLLKKRIFIKNEGSIF